MIPWGFGLPLFRKRLNWDGQGQNRRLDERTDLFATMMALYPFTDSKELSKEFCLAAQTINIIANSNGVYKAKEVRREICRKNATKQAAVAHQHTKQI